MEEEHQRLQLWFLDEVVEVETSLQGLETTKRRDSMKSSLSRCCSCCCWYFLDEVEKFQNPYFFGFVCVLGLVEVFILFFYGKENGKGEKKREKRKRRERGKRYFDFFF